MQGVEDETWLALFRSLYTKEFLPRLVPEVSRDLVENKDTADRREPGRSRIPFVIHHIWLGLAPAVSQHFFRSLPPAIQSSKKALRRCDFRVQAY